MMIHTTSESEITSLGASSSAGSSPKPPPAAPRQVYYVQSPSSPDSHEEDNKSSTSAAACTQTASSTFRSPSSESQSLLSPFGRQSRPSSAASRVSGSGRGGRKGRREREGRWLLGHVREGVDKEREFYVRWWKDEDGEELSRSCKVVMGVVVVGVVFLVGCSVIWGASKPFSAHVLLKNMSVNNLYYSEGTDHTGVATKMLTIKCSVKMRVHNPATFFGVYVSSSTIILRYFDLIIASGQMKTYYQPKMSWREVTVDIQGSKVPLYGAAPGLMDLSNDKLIDDGIPLTLEFELRSQGGVLGKLVRAKYQHHIRCSLTIDSHSTPIRGFSGDSCVYK